MGLRETGVKLTLVWINEEWMRGRIDLNEGQKNNPPHLNLLPYLLPYKTIPSSIMTGTRTPKGPHLGDIFTLLGYMHRIQNKL